MHFTVVNLKKKNVKITIFIYHEYHRYIKQNPRVMHVHNTIIHVIIEIICDWKSRNFKTQYSDLNSPILGY